MKKITLTKAVLTFIWAFLLVNTAFAQNTNNDTTDSLL